MTTEISFETDIHRHGQYYWWEASAYRENHGTQYLVGGQSSRNLGVTFQRKTPCAEHLAEFLEQWKDRLLDERLTLDTALTQLVELEYVFPHETGETSPLIVVPDGEYGYNQAASIRVETLQYSPLLAGDWVGPEPTDSRLGEVRQCIVVTP